MYEKLKSAKMITKILSYVGYTRPTVTNTPKTPQQAPEADTYEPQAAVPLPRATYHINRSFRSTPEVVFDSTKDIFLDKNGSGDKILTNGSINVENCTYNGNLETMFGEIFVHNCPALKGNLANSSGNINIDNSKITGNIENAMGYIKITGNSTIDGNIKNETGFIDIDNSRINNGDVTVAGDESILFKNKSHLGENATIVGANVVVKNSTADGQIKAKKLKLVDSIINNELQIDTTGLSLEGENKIKKLIFADNHPDKDSILIYKLPAGCKLETIIEFDSDYEGTLLIEEGAEFNGQIINGQIEKNS